MSVAQCLIVIAFPLMVFVCAALVVGACMLSSQISREEEDA